MWTCTSLLELIKPLWIYISNIIEINCLSNVGSKQFIDYYELLDDFMRKFIITC